MTPRLANMMKMHALLAANGRALARFGIVRSYNPATFSVKVELQPEGVITGWIPLGSPWIGSGWGMFAAPSIGDLIRVDFAGGDPDAGIASMRAFTDVNAPVSVPTGEFWIVHKSGSALRFHNDGSVDVVSAGKLNVTVGSDATVNVTGKAIVNATECDVTAPTSTWTGNLSVVGLLTAGSLAVTGTSGGATSANFAVPIAVTSGGITSQGSITTPNDVAAGTISLRNHVHGGVTTGSGNTAVPH